ncbi:hypothetical protein [Nocardia jejuensis]|uniref:hypothetical protein n=1 Tax=Nocardia jejuensis TaxID=328049 RepID=UPI0008377F79|nr:hypothetical protein [Nocardia jejuensis]
MTTLLVILIVWVALSIPAALILARMFRSSKDDARRRGDTELSRGTAELSRSTAESSRDTADSSWDIAEIDRRTE